MPFEYIKENSEKLLEKVRNAEKSSPYGQKAEVLAAVKYAAPEELEYLVNNTEIHMVGENRVQQLLEHYEILRGKADIHFIGSLQTNKVKYIIDKVSMIHSLDSLRLAAEIDKQAKKHGRVMDVLVEINCGREENKGGLFPEDVEEFCTRLSEFSSINLRGFMTMAPKCEEKTEYLQYFDKTYKLFLDIWRKIIHNNIEPVVSMGMSGNFEEAILCGATLVRIGRSFFEK